MTARTVKHIIVMDPSRCHGKPTFRGTRVMVSTILELLESGMSIPDILRGFPSIGEREIRAAIGYARMRIENEEFVPFAVHP